MREAHKPSRADYFQVDTDYLRGPRIIAIDENGLETARLGLEFRVANNHFRRGDMKLKCLATIATVYRQSNEKSVEGGDESVLKTSIMESRETRAQSHTREDLANGKCAPPPLLPSPRYILSYYPLPQSRNIAPRYRLTLRCRIPLLPCLAVGNISWDNLRSRCADVDYSYDIAINGIARLCLGRSGRGGM